MSTQTSAGIVPMIDLNPLHWLGDKAKEGLADGFASMMLGVWSAGVWLLRTAFGLIDNFTPSVGVLDAGVPLDRGVVKLRDSLKIAPLEGVIRRPDHLHVLLRHRPRSISLWP